jgi:alginate O-acetyltransferase complex protein AlgJ
LIKLLNQHFVLGHTFAQIEHGFLWNLTGDLGNRVRAGCDNWLFLTDELEIYQDRARSAQFRVERVEQLHQRLAERGIKLLVTVIPDKSRVESAHLCGLPRPVQFDSRIDNWLGQLSAKGIETLNLTPTLATISGDRYLRTDTHWNEAGAYAAAAVISDKLRLLNWVTLPAEPVSIATTRVEHDGDLIRLANLDGLPSWLRPSVEITSITDVAPLTVISDDLFGDAGLPSIVLIGTSYSRNSNFAPFLEHALGERIINLSKEGGDFFGSAADYLTGGTYSETPHTLVIWEIPERVLEMPLLDIERKEWVELSPNRIFSQ